MPQVDAQIVAPDANVYPARIADHGGTAGRIGDHIGYVMDDDVGSDHGVQVRWNVPDDYSPSTVEGNLLIKFMINGTPGAADIVGLTFAGLPLVSNDDADAAYGTPDLFSDTIGSDDLGIADGDLVVFTLPLSNLAAMTQGGMVVGKLSLDVSVTDYSGGVILLSVEFDYETS